MRGLLILVFALVVAGTAGAGMIIPEPVDSQQPRWLVDGQHVEFRYALAPRGSVVSPTPAVVADDGSGQRPATPDDVVAHPDLAVRDGHIAGFANDGNLYADGRMLTSGGNGYPGWQPIAWSPDGTRIAFTWGGAYGSATSAEVDVVPAAGGTQKKVAAGTSVAWIDDHTLAVGREGYATDIDRVDLRTGRTTRLVSGYYSPGGFDISPDGSEIVFTAYVGNGYDRGAVVYAASTSGLDRNVRRLTPDTCTVKPTLYFAKGRCIDGTDGGDVLTGTRYADVIAAGPGDDDIRAGAGDNTIQAQWGNDTIRSGNQADLVKAGGGNDTIRTGGGDDLIDAGPGRDVVFAGAGADHIDGNDGERDVIDCGPGPDAVRADRIDVLRHCERVTYEAPDPEQGPS